MLVWGACANLPHQLREVHYHHY